LTNTTRMRIIQYLQIEGEATTKQISEGLPDIPAPTIYRHVRQLLEGGILIVKEERKVRGTTERLLDIDWDVWPSNNGPDVSDTVYQFLMSLYDGFRTYLSKEGYDMERDKLFLRTCMLSLTDESFDRFISEYKVLLERYLEPEDGGRLRRVSTISSPVVEEGCHDE